MTEYTSLEVSKRLAGAGFKEEQDTDKGWFSTPASGESLFYYTSAYCPNDLEHIAYAYRSDTLLAWLLNKPIFSKRPWSIHIAVVAEMADNGKWERRYRMAADCGDGSEICTFAPTLPDALGEVVMRVMGVSK
jgi:hypothetical protein